MSRPRRWAAEVWRHHRCVSIWTAMQVPALARRANASIYDHDADQIVILDREQHAIVARWARTGGWRFNTLTEPALKLALLDW